MTGGAYNRVAGDNWAASWLWSRGANLKRKKIHPSVRHFYPREDTEWDSDDDPNLDNIAEAAVVADDSMEPPPVPAVAKNKGGRPKGSLGTKRRINLIPVAGDKKRKTPQTSEIELDHTDPIPTEARVEPCPQSVIETPDSADIDKASECETVPQIPGHMAASPLVEGQSNKRPLTQNHTAESLRNHTESSKRRSVDERQCSHGDDQDQADLWRHELIGDMYGASDELEQEANEVDHNDSLNGEDAMATMYLNINPDMSDKEMDR